MPKTKEQLARRAMALKKHRKLHPEKWIEWRKKDYLKHKDKYIENERKQRLQKNFGLSIEQYDEMFLKQGGLCHICHLPETSKNSRKEIKKLAVDHNHITGKIRGLLCAKCNQAIGLLGDSPDRLRAA